MLSLPVFVSWKINPDKRHERFFQNTFDATASKDGAIFVSAIIGGEGEKDTRDMITEHEQVDSIVCPFDDDDWIPKCKKMERKGKLS